MKTCFIPGCKTGYKSNIKQNRKLKLQNKSIFNAPKDPKMLQIWSHAIRRDDKVLSITDGICEDHFSKEDISRFFETPLPDGSVHRVERRRPKLKDIAIPHIFPNLSKNLTTVDKKPKPVMQRKPLVKKLKRSSVGASCNISFDGHVQPEMLPAGNPLLQSANQNSSDTQGVSFFEELKCNPGVIATPHPNWASTFIPGMNKVVFAEWDSDFENNKKVVVNPDLTIIVLFQDIEIKVEGSSVTSATELADLLQFVNTMRLCTGIQDKWYLAKCLGTVQPKKPDQRDFCSNKCLPCQSFSLKMEKLQARVNALTHK